MSLFNFFIILGEVSIENENWTQAVEDLQACLVKRKELSSDSRLIAETHYQLGLITEQEAQRAIEAKQGHPVIMEFLQKAKGHFEKSIELDHKHKKASDALKRVITTMQRTMP